MNAFEEGYTFLQSKRVFKLQGMKAAYMLGKLTTKLPSCCKT